MSRTAVGVLRGGTSSEYPLSLNTGAAMMSALSDEAYDVRDILIDKAGMWHLRGKPVEPARALQQLDVALNALHGGVGEDGTVQRILERAGVPYAGSRALSAGLALNKIRARALLQRAGITMPRAISFSTENQMDTRDMAEATFSAFGPPYIIKPPLEGSSIGIKISPTILQLPEMLGDVLDTYGSALVEEYMLGDHLTIGVIEGFRGEDIYTLPPSHIELSGGARYFDPHAEEGSARFHVPSTLSPRVKAAVADVARAAHQVLRLAHFSDADFVVARSGKPYLLEVNAQPHLHEKAAFPRMLEAVGSSLREFLEHIISLARRGV